MIITSTEIYDRLVELDGGTETPFTMASGVSEHDVQIWYDSIDVPALEAGAGAAIDRGTVTDFTTPQDIIDDNLSVADVINSRGDDPADFDAAYLIRNGGVVVQYFKPHASGKEPIPASDVDAYLSDHVDEIVTRTVNAELLSRAKIEFGA